MKFSDIQLDDKYINNVYKNYKYNKRISFYYEKLGEEFSSPTISRKAKNVLNCCKVWNIRKYGELNLKNVERVTLCKDKFCNNCKKVLQAARSMKFLKLLEGYDDYIYHMVLTLPSCSGQELKNTISKLFKGFTKLNRVLNGNYKTEIWDSKGVFNKNITLESFGYAGALRSLEVTWGKDEFGNTWYHPHLHVAILFMDPDFVLSEKNMLVEPYSWKRNDTNVYPFSIHDKFIQRLWYLIINKQPITKNNMENIHKIRKKLKDDIRGQYKNTGYSCSITKFDKGRYAELFKYIIKSVDYEKNIMDYETFKDLYFALRGCRQLQGYGFFYNISDDSYENEINEINEFLEEFMSNYSFKNINEHMATVARNITKKKELYISRKRIFNFIKKQEELPRDTNKPDETQENTQKEKYNRQIEEFTSAYYTYKKIKNKGEI